MPYNPVSQQWDLSLEMERLRIERESSLKLRERKHLDWNDNYELYRNKVKTNRLTQRQAVNIPLMKETIKTLLTRIDDAPEVDWSENSGDEEKEIIYQEIWDDMSRHNKLELIDVLDKKNVLLYGQSIKKLNIIKDGIGITVLDTFDVGLDPLMVPWDIESSRFIIHSNIFRRVRDILADDRYTKEGKANLMIWANSEPGITQSDANRKEMDFKLQRLKDMGVNSSDFSKFAGGDRLINLTEHHTTRWDDKLKKFERRVVVYADSTVELMDSSLDEAIGVDFWPFTYWAEDPETNDIYPDSVADLVRTPNKVLNVWYSQLIENRTLKNFQMHWYMPSQNYQPQTYTPGPGMMLAAPPGDDINKVIRPVEISGLDDTLEAISVLTNIVERGTGATALEKGQSQAGVQTLGEVQILVGKATERVISMAKFYRMSWYELAWKWDKLMQANAPTFIKLVKRGASGKAYPKRIYSADWKSTAGYEPRISSSSEQEQNDIKTLQKWNFVLQQNPNNPALKELAMKRQVKLLDVTPEELRQIEQAQPKTVNPADVSTPGGPQQTGQSNVGLNATGAPTGLQPGEAQLAAAIQQKAAVLGGQ